METTKLQEAIIYFKQPGFERLFKGFQKRYISLGRVGGSVTLHSLNEDELDALEGFFQKDCHHKKSLTVSVDTMEKALAKTRFSEVSFEEILHGYFPKELISKRQHEEERKIQTEKHFLQMVDGYEKTKAGQWFLKMLEEKEGVYSSLHQDEMKNTSWALENIPYLLKALEMLPLWHDEKQRIAVFASAVTGNPHYFDETNKMFRYLLYGICGVCNIQYPQKQNAEVKAELLYQAGILKDDISSNVTCIGIRGYLYSGEIHDGIEGFLKQGEMVQLNMYHLGKLKSIHSVGQKVYVVENPSIFQKLAEETKGKVCVVCSNGQLRLAVLVLLDLLTDTGSQILYSGDFDPEGLMIAQKLKNRYHEKLQLWHYECEDYTKAKSMEEISEKRLRQLENVTCEELQGLVSHMKREKLSGYQENIWQEFMVSK